MRNQVFSNTDGFTLLEVLLVIALGIILLLIAAPSYQDFIVRNRAANSISQVISAIQAARNEAIAQGQTIIFCGSSDQVRCDGQWQAGQITLTENAKILRIYSAISPGDRFWWQSSLGQNNELKLAATGFTAGQRGSFYYCPKYKPGSYGAKIIVSDSGRIRVDSDKNELETVCGDE